MLALGSFDHLFVPEYKWIRSIGNRVSACGEDTLLYRVTEERAGGDAFLCGRKPNLFLFWGRSLLSLTAELGTAV